MLGRPRFLRKGKKTKIVFSLKFHGFSGLFSRFTHRKNPTIP
jgi:hypothetical protein